MHKIFIFLNLLSFSLFCLEKEKPLSYDSDLFRKNEKVFFVNAEFLYWAIDEGVSDYAIRMEQPPWGNTTDAIGHYKHASFDWDPGFRFNFGYFNAPHYWDIYAQYTYFKGDGKNHVKAPTAPGLLLNGTWAHPDPTGTVSLATASSEISLKMNLLEVLVSRRFHPNPHLRIEMYGGFNMLWIRQNWEVNYQDLNNQKSSLRNDWRYKAPGIRTGFSLDWFLGRHGFYLTASSSLCCFSGYYRNSSKETSTYAQGGYNPSLPLKNTLYRDVRLVPQFKALIGPSWQWSFERARTEIFLGYEFSILTNLQETYRSSNGAPSSSKQTYVNGGSIGMQGGTLRANLDF